MTVTLPAVMAGGYRGGNKTNNHRGLIAMAEDLADAGADVICAPTFEANAVLLRDEDHGSRIDDINRRIIEDTKSAAGEGVLIAGGIGPCRLDFETWGNTDFMQCVDVFARHALALRDGGADLIFIDGIEGMWEMRAAVIGARQAKLPVYACLCVNGCGEAQGGGSALICLLCLQQLGVAGFGLSYGGQPGEIAHVFREIMPFAEVPLAVVIDMHDTGEFTSQCETLLCSGVRIFSLARNISRELTGDLAKLCKNFDPAGTDEPERYDHAIILCGEQGVFFLDEDFTLSEPVECELDMSAGIIGAEDSGVDAVLFHVKSVEDSEFFSLNCNMVKAGVCILAESEEALEMALLAYNGRAMIDARSDVCRTQLETLARGYGAIVR